MVHCLLHCYYYYYLRAPVKITFIAECPSECLNYKFLNESNRAQGYSSRNRLPLCDDKLSENWYRFSGGAGDKMPDYCVEKLSCGTHAPGWLNTPHPSVADGIIETNVCFHWGSDCCYWSATIKVRNCGVFFVYQLNKTPYCNLRYCGNKEKGRKNHLRKSVKHVKVTVYLSKNFLV